MPSIGVRTYELATLGAARGIPSPHCLLAHGRKTLRAEALDEDQLERVALDYETAGLERRGRRGDALRREAVDGCRGHDGCRFPDAARPRVSRDRQIVDIALAAGARNFFSRALQALAVPVEDVPGLSPRLAAALLSPAIADRAATPDCAPQWWMSAFSRMRMPPNAAVEQGAGQAQPEVARPLRHGEPAEDSEGHRVDR